MRGLERAVVILILVAAGSLLLGWAAEPAYRRYVAAGAFWLIAGVYALLTRTRPRGLP